MSALSDEFIAAIEKVIKIDDTIEIELTAMVPVPEKPGIFAAAACTIKLGDISLRRAIPMNSWFQQDTILSDDLPGITPGTMLEGHASSSSASSRKIPTSILQTRLGQSHFIADTLSEIEKKIAAARPAAIKQAVIIFSQQLIASL